VRASMSLGGDKKFFERRKKMETNYQKAVEILFEAGKKKPIMEVLKILGLNAEKGLDADVLRKIASICYNSDELSEFDIAKIIKATSFCDPQNAAFWVSIITEPFEENFKPIISHPEDVTEKMSLKVYTVQNGIALGVFETATLDEYPDYRLEQNIPMAIKKMIFCRNKLTRIHDQAYNQNIKQKSGGLKKFQGQLCNLIKAFGKKLRDEENELRLSNVRPLITHLDFGLKELEGKDLSCLGLLIMEQINYAILNLLSPLEIQKVLADYITHNR